MNPHLEPWNHSAEDFPSDSYASDQLEFLLGYAILAPSPYNTQPWLFRINAMDVEIFLDRRRGLPVIDPDGRQMTLSAGAALYNLQVATEYFGHQYQVDLWPNPQNPDLVAQFHLGLSGETSSDDILVFQAIPRRHTNRHAFRAEPIPEPIQAGLRQAAREQGAELLLVTSDDARDAVAEFVAEADRRQWARKEFREELARWIRTKPEAHRDGLPTHDVGIQDWLSFAGPAMIRTFDRGGGQAARDRDIAVHSPLLAVLWTTDDQPASWLQAGRALQSVLLHARSEDVWASFLSQPLEVAELRPEFAAALGLSGHPQALLRLGYGETPLATPRRSVRECLIMHRTPHAT